MASGGPGTTPSGGPPAGWYADPYGRAQQRYWDGAAWTGHTSDVPPSPQTAPAAPGEGEARPAGAAGSLGARLQNPKVLALFLGVFAVVVIGGAIAVALAAPDARKAECEPNVPCRGPGGGAPPLVTNETFRASDTGFQLEFNSEAWTKTAEDGRSVTFEFAPPDGIDSTTSVVIGSAPAGERSPDDVLQSQLDSLGESFVSLTEDTDPAHRIFGASVGYRDGVGGAYTGAADTPQGPGQPVAAVIMAATDDEVTAYVSVLTDEQDEERRRWIYGEVDTILNTLLYPSELS